MQTRLLDQVIGHQHIVERFLAGIEAGRLSHAFLFVGSSGIGKKMTALALAQALACETSSRGCGRCGSCLRALKLPSESILLVEPEKNIIKIEQAHQILEFLSLRSWGRRRVVIIDRAEELNPQAGNALLKVIEEPPAETFFFLIAASPSQVLSTLRSRSQIVHFAPLQIEEMRKKVRAPDWALRASQGSFEKLRQLSQREELEIRESAAGWLEDWLDSPQGYLKPEHRDLVRDRQVAISLSQHLCWFFRDAAYLQSGVEKQILNVDKKSLLEKLAGKMSAERLLENCLGVLRLQNALDANFDSALTFEEFWIQTRISL